MPVLRKYRGRYVVRVQKHGNGLRLTMANRRPGEKHERIVITRTEWQRYGSEEFVASIPNLRTG